MDARSRAVLTRLREEERAAGQSRQQTQAQKLLVRLFPQQRDFVLDPARRKALLCPRRAGKSYAAAVYLLYVALSTPRANVAFVTLTRLRAKKILWRVLKNLNADFELGISWNETELTGTLPNGSTVTLGGCEDSSQVDKFRGEAFHLFLIDETKSFAVDLLAELLEEAVEPALADYRGTLALMGTPGAVLEGTFYDITGPKACIVYWDNDERRAISQQYSVVLTDLAPPVTYEWSFHSWTMADNKAMPHLWHEALSLKARKGWRDDNPKWQREYLGVWIADSSDLVYAFDDGRNTWIPGPKTEHNPFGLPTGHEWYYLLGLDLGYRDRTALQIGAFSPTHPCFFQVFEHTEPGLHLTPIVAAIRKAERLCGGFIGAVGDYAGGGAAKILYETLALEHGIAIEAAQKTHKHEHIELLNSDLLDGRCKLLKDSMIVREMRSLVWDDDARRLNKWKEAEGLPNDACDAFLYLRTKAYHHFAEPPPVVVDAGTPEAEEAREEAEMRRAEEQAMRGSEPDWTYDDAALDADASFAWRG